MEPRYEEEPECRGWFDRLHLSWPMLFLAGWLLYELTAQPGLGALVACAKFGWADVRTAFWLRRVDPDRRRGRVCFWCCLAFGLWKVAMMATATMIGLGISCAILECVRGQPLGNGGELAMFTGAMIAAATGGGLSCLTTHIALWSARGNDFRIWMGDAPRRAWQERFWPPCHGRVNAAPFVVYTALGVTLWLLIVLTIALLLVCRPGEFWLMIGGVFSLMTSAILVLALHDAAKRRFARSPQECWNAEEDETVHQVHGTEEEIGNA